MSSKNQHKSMTKEIESMRLLLLGVSTLFAGAAMLPWQALFLRELLCFLGIVEINI